MIPKWITGGARPSRLSTLLGRAAPGIDSNSSSDTSSSSSSSVAAVQLGRGVLAGGRREDQRGLPADGTTSDKGACCCPPDARAVLCGSLLAALHACSACGGRYALLVPLVPLGGVCCAWPALKQAQWAARARTSTCQTRARCSTVAHEPRCTSSVGVTGATLHYITLHYITLHHITSHYITLHYITSHHITLPYMQRGIHCTLEMITRNMCDSHTRWACCS